jgi:ABC-type cobalamin/Fe3+-siderophores transport system ATPase subunit
MNLAQNNPIIELEDVTVTYPHHTALESISLAVREREFVGIAGPNGAGKTTLLCAINGLSHILCGTVCVFGKNLFPHIAAIRRDIGYVPQIIACDPRIPLRVREVVSMGRYARISFLKRFSVEDRNIVEDVAEVVGISRLMDRPIGHLSGGEQRKVAIARALTQEPKILLLDEPVSHLDLNAQAAILALIEKVHAEKNLTTIMVSHQLDLLPESCNRLVLLKEGRIVFTGATQEGLKEDILSRLYGCPVKIIRNGGGCAIRVGTHF